MELATIFKIMKITCIGIKYLSNDYNQHSIL